MIVSESLAGRIAAGQVTQLRMPAIRRPPAEGRVVPITCKVPNIDLGYDGNGDPKTEPVERARIRILGVATGKLEEVTQSEAHALGYRYRQDFLDWFCAHWRVGDKSLPVWVVHFELVREHRARFLAFTRHFAPGRQGDYTTNSARAFDDAGEVPEADLHDRWAEEAQDKHVDELERRRAAHVQLPLNEQIAELEKEARSRHIDVRDELRAIKKFRGRDPRVVDRQLEKMREKLWRARVAA